MAEPSEYDYLDQVLPGFSEARALVKSAGDSVKPFGFFGDKFEFYRFANRKNFQRRLKLTKAAQCKTQSEDFK